MFNNHYCSILLSSVLSSVALHQSVYSGLVKVEEHIGKVRKLCSAESRQSLEVIKNMGGDQDSLARTPVKVLMVAGHATCMCVCVCVPCKRTKAAKKITVMCVNIWVFSYGRACCHLATTSVLHSKTAHLFQ